jgi:hypothetical protein
LSRYSWNDVSEAFFHESLQRQVFHYLVPKENKAERPRQFHDDNSHYSIDDHDDLLSVGSTPRAADGVRAPYCSPSGPSAFFPHEDIQNENLDDSARFSPELAYLGDAADEISMHYRLFRTFEVTKMSGRICLFQIYFLQMVSGNRDALEDGNTDDDHLHSKITSQKEDLQIYNASLGFPTSMVRSELVDEFKKIVAVNDYEGLLFRMQLLYTPKQLNIFLRNAVRNAIKYDVVKGFDFELLEGSRKPEDPKEFDITHATDHLSDDGTDVQSSTKLYREWSKLWKEARTTHQNLHDRYPDYVQRWTNITVESKSKKANDSSPARRQATDNMHRDRSGTHMNPISPKINRKQRRYQNNQVLESIVQNGTSPAAFARSTVGIADRFSASTRTYSAVAASNRSVPRFPMQFGQQTSTQIGSSRGTGSVVAEATDLNSLPLRVDKPTLSRTSSNSSGSGFKSKSSTPTYGTPTFAGFSPSSSASRKQFVSNKKISSVGSSGHQPSPASHASKQSSTNRYDGRAGPTKQSFGRQASTGSGGSHGGLKSSSKDAADSASIESSQSSQQSRRTAPQVPVGSAASGRPRSGSIESFLSLNEENKESRNNNGLARLKSLPTKFECVSVPVRGRSSSLGDSASSPRDCQVQHAGGSPQIGATNPRLLVETKAGVGVPGKAGASGKASALRAEASSFTPMSTFSGVSTNTNSMQSGDNISVANSATNSRITDHENRSLCSYSSLSTIATILDNGTVIPASESKQDGSATSSVKEQRLWSKVAAGINNSNAVEAVVSLLNIGDDFSLGGRSGTASGSNSGSNSARADFLDPAADADLEIEGTTIFDGVMPATSQAYRAPTSSYRNGSNNPERRRIWSSSQSTSMGAHTGNIQTGRNVGGRFDQRNTRRWPNERTRTNSGAVSVSDSSYINDSNYSWQQSQHDSQAYRGRQPNEHAQRYQQKK